MFSIYAFRKPNCRGIVNLSVYVLLKAGLLTIKNINYKKKRYQTPVQESMQKATYVYAITFRVGEAARFRYRTLVAVGVRVFKAEPDLHVHETASLNPEVNTNYELSSKKAKLCIQHSSKHEVIREIRCIKHISMH